MKEIRDDPSFMGRTADPFRRPAQHPLGFQPDAEDVAGGLIDSSHGGLVEDYALAFHEDQRIGGPQVHRKLARGRPGLQRPAVRSGLWRQSGTPWRASPPVDIDRYAHWKVPQAGAWAANGLHISVTVAFHPRGSTRAARCLHHQIIGFVRERLRPASAAAFAQALEACEYDPQSGHHRQAAEDRAAEAGSPSRWTRRPASSREPLRRASRRSPDPDSLGRPAFSVPAKRAQTAPSQARVQVPPAWPRISTSRWSRWERRLPCS